MLLIIQYCSIGGITREKMSFGGIGRCYLKANRNTLFEAVQTTRRCYIISSFKSSSLIMWMDVVFMEVSRLIPMGMCAFQSLEWVFAHKGINKDSFFMEIKQFICYDALNQGIRMNRY